MGACFEDGHLSSSGSKNDCIMHFVSRVMLTTFKICHSNEVLFQSVHLKIVCNLGRSVCVQMIVYEQHKNLSVRAGKFVEFCGQIFVSALCNQMTTINFSLANLFYRLIKLLCICMFARVCMCESLSVTVSTRRE